MSTVLHIATTSDWEAAQHRGHYVAPSLETDGFIHCSTAEQAIPIANALFRGQSNLLLLLVDDERATADIRYEPPATLGHSTGSELFPHLYGPLNIDAVIAVKRLTPNPDGSFDWPFPNP